LLDLHTHTNESDGSFAPAQLVTAAASAGVRALAITDHDTFEGYLAARSAARDLGLDLICGIELSTRFQGRPIHLLGYFLHTAPTLDFSKWLRELAERRRERNRRLAERLTEVGAPVAVEEAEAIGRTITGRVHFARILQAKGYATSIQDAFRRYIGEGAPAYVEVEDPPVADAIAQVRRANGFPVIAHPGRYRMQPADEEQFLNRAAAAGLGGLEAIHSDHDPGQTARYRELAARMGLTVTGGSDFHGDAKPLVRLGHGDQGRLPIPLDWLDALRNAVSRD
jgi:predicted metal-dependent phosphoesterase TrpH